MYLTAASIRSKVNGIRKEMSRRKISITSLRDGITNYPGEKLLFRRLSDMVIQFLQYWRLNLITILGTGICHNTEERNSVVDGKIAIGTIGFDYEYRIEYEYDFSNLVCVV